jgi:hypothetical protein
MFSPRPKSGSNGLDQRGIAEWLEQARHGTSREQTRLKCPIALRSYEDDRHILAAPDQLALEIRSAHTRQSDVEDQTLRRAGSIRGEELLRRWKSANLEPDLLQQVRQ